MTYTPPDFEEVRTSLIASLQADLPELDVSEGSEPWHIASAISQAVIGSIGNSKSEAQNVNPLYSKKAFLALLGSRYGLDKEPSVNAAGGSIEVDVTGTGSWLITQQFRSADGLTYVATSAGTWSASGTVEIPIDAVDTGAATTKSPGAVFTVLSPPAGMASTGTLLEVDAVLETAFTTPGKDEETDEEYRQRLVNRLQGQGNSGNEGDYIGWMESILGISESYVYTEMRNSLSLDGVIFGPKTVPGQRWDGLLSLCTDAENYINGTGLIEGQRAVGQDYDCVAPTAENVSVDITIDSDPEYGRDWGAAPTTDLQIVQVNPGLMSISVSDDPQPGGGTADSDLKVGDRIAVNIRVPSSPNHFHVEVRTITRIVDVPPGGILWVLHVDEPFTSSTYSSDIVYEYVVPAGPTTEATVTALEALFDTFTPADDANSSRWPPVSAEHPTDLTSGRLNKAVLGVEVDGILRHWDVTITTPAVPVAATASAIAGGVLVANTLRLYAAFIRYNTLNTD